MSYLNIFRPKSKAKPDPHGEAKGLVTYAVLAIGDATDALDEAVELTALSKRDTTQRLIDLQRMRDEEHDRYDAAHRTFLSADKLHEQLNALTAGLVLGE